MIIGFIVAAVVVVLDQISKYFLYGKSLSLIGDFLWLESTFNKGASFGIMQNATIFFIILSLPAIAIMVYLIITKKYINSKLFKISIALLLGGTIGNFIDRVFLGGVRDFIYFKSIDFAIFNVADMAITFGVILAILYFIIAIIKKDKEASKPLKKEDDKVNDSEKLEELNTLRETLKNAKSDKKSVSKDDKNK